VNGAATAGAVPGGREVRRMAKTSANRSAWGVAEQRRESRIPATIALLVSIAIQFKLPDPYALGPVWLLPSLELAILIPLTLIAPVRVPVESHVKQIAAMLLIALAQLANLVALVHLVQVLVYHGKSVTGDTLLLAAVGIWVTNVIVFSLWYWELDRGGPDARMREDHDAPDFLFPQMTTPGCANEDWAPAYFDYFYLAYTNATAFSPTDTLPLSPMAKAMMALQSTASLVVIAIVAARAVNILT